MWKSAINLYFNSTLTIHTLKFYFYETIHCNKMKHSSGQKYITSQHLTFFGMAEVEIVIPQQLTRICFTKLLQQVPIGLVISPFLQLSYTLSRWAVVGDKIWTPSSQFHNTTLTHLERMPFWLNWLDHMRYCSSWVSSHYLWISVIKFDVKSMFSIYCNYS